LVLFAAHKKQILAQLLLASNTLAELEIILKKFVLKQLFFNVLQLKIKPLLGQNH
jgi:hypothetical protein